MGSQIRSELQRLGIAKVDLAFRAVKMKSCAPRTDACWPAALDRQVHAGVSVQLRAGESGTAARDRGGSGAQSPARNASHGETAGIELEKIKPGMNKEDLDRVRQEISQAGFTSHSWPINQKPLRLQPVRLWRRARN